MFLIPAVKALNAADHLVGGVGAVDRPGLVDHPVRPWSFTRPSSSGSPASRRTSEPRRPRRPGPSLCIAPAGSGQDDDPRRAGRLADRDRDAARGDPRDHLQQAGGRRDDRAAGRGRGAAGRARRRRPGPDVPCARPRDPARRRRRRGADGRPAGRPAERGALGRRGRPASTRHGGLPAQGRAGRLRGRRRRRPRGRPGRARVRGLRSGRRGERRARLRRPDPARDRAPSRATPACSTRWRGRCRELLVDEVQDVDRAQLRLALLLAAPANRIFLVGDDDQSIYGWRLADVRRILGLAEHLPGLRRVDLEVNYRCPRTVVERAVRLVERNGERFAKRIRAGPAATGRLVLAPDASDETVRLERAIRTWPDDDSTRAVLARTNRELLPAVVVALDLGLPFRAPRIELLLDSPAARRSPGARDRRRGATRASRRSSRSGAPAATARGRPGAGDADRARDGPAGWAVGHAGPGSVHRRRRGQPGRGSPSSAGTTPR